MVSTTCATGVIPSCSKFLSISCLSSLLRPATAVLAAVVTSIASRSFLRACVHYL